MVLQINNTGVITPEIIGKVAPLFGDQNNMLIFSAVVFGLGLRTVYRYWQERKDGNPDALAGFDVKFLYTALMAFIAAGLPAMALMPSATATFNAFVPGWGIVFAWAFTAGGIYAANAGINAGVSMFEKRTVANAAKAGKFDNVIKERMEYLKGEEGSKPVEQQVQPVSSQPAQGENTPQSNQPVS